MAMNIQGGSGGGGDDVMSNINTTPLVDIMLVLLIIFLITVPVITQSVKVNLPDAANQANQTKPENIIIAVDKDGKVYWNVTPLDNDTLLTRLKDKAVQVPQPEVQIRADKDVRYEFVGVSWLIASAQVLRKWGSLPSLHRDTQRNLRVSKPL